MTDSTALEKDFAKWVKQVDIGDDIVIKKTAVRIRRAISWLRRAEKESQDEDARVIFLWISFNALYGVKSEEKEWEKYKSFLEEISKSEVDAFDKIHGAIKKCHDECIKLAKNRYIDRIYWANVDVHIKNYSSKKEPENKWKREAKRSKYGTISKVDYESLKNGNKDSVSNNLVALLK